MSIPVIPQQRVFALGEDAVERALDFGFVVVKRPGLRSLITACDKAWRAYCDQPVSHKQRHTVRLAIDDPDEGPDNGYVNRYGELVPAGEATKDQKEYWHSRPFVAEKVLVAVRPSKIDKELLVATRHLYDELEHDLYRFAHAFDRACPGFAVEESMRRMGDPQPFGHVLRLLHYKYVVEPGEEIAKVHTDRDAITLHVADSHPGLVVYLRGGEEFLAPTLPDTLIVFFGRRMSVRTKGQVKSLAHRVISPEEAGIPNERRTCEVFFGQTEDHFKNFRPADVLS